MIKEIIGVYPIMKCFSTYPCPVCRTQMTLVSTTNEWTNYCKACDKRYNDRDEEMDLNVAHPLYHRP